MINFKLIFISLFLCTLAFSDDYIKIELSDSKNKLSKEVFQKLQKNHYLKKINTNDLNERYFEAIIQKFDENKNLFLEEEIQTYLKQSRNVNENYFDIKLAYELINLYFERLIQYSKYQISLVKKDSFDFSKDEFLSLIHI